jgi:hypothetical protein
VRICSSVSRTYWFTTGSELSSSALYAEYERRMFQAPIARNMPAITPLPKEGSFFVRPTAKLPRNHAANTAKLIPETQSARGDRVRRM